MSTIWYPVRQKSSFRGDSVKHRRLANNRLFMTGDDCVLHVPMGTAIQLTRIRNWHHVRTSAHMWNQSNSLNIWKNMKQCVLTERPSWNAQQSYWSTSASNLDWKLVQQTVGMDLSQDLIPPCDQLQSSWKDLKLDSRLPGMKRFEWPIHTGKNSTPISNLAPQSPWSPDSLRLKSMRRRDTWKKLAIKELSTGLLIHTLMLRANILEHLPTHAQFHNEISPDLLQIALRFPSQVRRARRDLLRNIERLQSIDINALAVPIAEARLHIQQPAIPQYFQDSDGDFHGLCQQMNSAIKKLLQHYRGDEKMEALGIAKICHNLLVSTAAPDLQTFNILLSGFKLWQRSKLVDDVIAAFYAQKIRPNEITCREIINHYVNESRPDDFSLFVARMRGTANALMLADPNTSVNEAGQGRLLRINEKKVLQKVFPSPMIFNALMNGVLLFAGFDRALNIYFEMKEDGWGLDVQGLTNLLKDCVNRVDWEGGGYIWEEINHIKSHASKHDMTEAYHIMLSLCSVTKNTVAFNRVLKEAAQRGFNCRKIVHSATRIIQQAYGKGALLAPAWTADNVLNAVSAPYYDDEDDEGRQEDEYMEDVVITNIDLHSKSIIGPSRQ